MTDPEVRLERHSGTAVLTLDAPKRRNVLSAAMVAGIGEAFDALEDDPSAKCVIITGAGAAFCAGADLATLESAADGDFEPVRTVYEGFLRVLRSPLPSIAAVNGAAVGAGFNLALACDVRLAGQAARFDTRFSALRLHPGGGHTWLLTRAVGHQQAVLACLFGERWDAQAALEHGLVAAVHRDSELLPAALALAGRLDGHTQDFIRTLTGTLRSAASNAGYTELLETETEAQKWSLTTPEFRTGVQEIRERLRSPDGRG